MCRELARLRLPQAWGHYRRAGRLNRRAATDRIWFYDVEHDGFSLDDNRQPVAENDLPNVLRCWRQRKDGQFQTDRERRLNELKAQVTPLQADIEQRAIAGS